jgi:stearoyl-CoA desaturase (delta-9 desaturase)
MASSESSLKYSGPCDRDSSVPLSAAAAETTNEGGVSSAKGLDIGSTSTMKPSIHRAFNLAIAIVPVIGLAVAVILLWNDLVTIDDLVIMAVMYFLASIGITMGYHRLLTHRAFATYPAIKYALAIAGSMAGQGPPIIWVADHRKHHAFSDEAGDPHSPHLESGTGIRAGARGLWHAHMGWLFRLFPASEPTRYARDLVRDSGMRRISASFFGLVALGLFIPALAGFAITGTARGALIAFTWGGLVRLFLGYHIVFSINSVCHYFGRRRFYTEDESRNVFWLAIPSLGESWHHNHHAFPTSARHGLAWWEIDITGLLIIGLKRLGLVWNVVEVSPETQRGKQRQH